MSLTLQEFKSDCVVCATVVCDGRVDARAFVNLGLALDAIKDHIDSGEATYVAVEAHVRGSAPSTLYEDRICESSPDQFVPFARFTTEFWDQALTDPALQGLLQEFVANVENLSRYATRDEGGIWYLCESDMVLFCQPILCYLAMRCIAFVPNYTRMLSYWRTEEASDLCAHDVLSIAQQHGECPETDALIRSYFANGGSHLDPDDYAHLLDEME
jgi:hypothetical protein